ncbi:hypothetical protein LCGC14_1418890 [marine sediment metagenome]|uniref:Uncharacterized protein n=1 Tax=marine sediment metagenome TaxID=412755 RepID=A0A0F9JRS8_9ZZZZ
MGTLGKKDLSSTLTAIGDTGWWPENFAQLWEIHEAINEAFRPAALSRFLVDYQDAKDCSVREISRQLGMQHLYVNELLTIRRCGNPLILKLWDQGHQMATMRNLTDVVYDCKRRDDHDKQWEAWLIVTLQAPEGTEGEGEGPEECDECGAPICVECGQYSTH